MRCNGGKASFRVFLVGKIYNENQVEKYFLNLAGEFAVCSELAKRNIQANLTLGNKKSVDLIILKEENK